MRIGQEVQALPRRLSRSLLLTLVLALAGFVLVAVAFEQEPLETVDVEVAQWAATELHDVFVWTGRFFSWLGGWIGLTFLGVLAGLLLVRERAWLDLLFLLVALVGSQIVVALLKAGFDRARPNAGSAVPLPGSLSFPSGHATSAVAGFGALTVLASERLPSRRARVWLWSAAVLVGLAIGLSRIVLNVHYVTDVLAGWCLGLAWLAGCLLAREAVRARAMSA